VSFCLADSTDDDSSDDDSVEAVPVVKKVARPQGRSVLEVFYFPSAL
jgi:hypothetical protein